MQRMQNGFAFCNIENQWFRLKNAENAENAEVGENKITLL